jgi:hypothetical protein
VLARALPIGLLCALVASLAASPAAATHSRGKCRQGGTTLAKNDSGRVFERETGLGANLYGCLWSRNKAVLMEVAEGDDFTTFERYYDLLLRGRYVAWVFEHEDVSCKAACPPGYDATTHLVKVFDLQAHSEEAQLAEPATGTLRLNTAGAAAWLQAAEGGNRDVHAWDRDGHRVLDSGAIRRYRLRGPTLSWVNGDAQRSATLR